MSDEPSSINGIELLYKEAAIAHRYQADLRHKMAVRYFVTIGSLLFISKWMWETNNSNVKAFLFLPFFLGVLTSLAVYLLDKRNTKMMRICISVGSELEKALYDNGGYYKSYIMMDNNNKTSLNIGYSIILRAIYLSIGVFFLGFTIGLFVNEFWPLLAFKL